MGELLNDPLGKFQTFQEVSSAGIIGIPQYTVKAENTLKAVVSGSAGANLVTIYGRIEGDPVWSSIGTISVDSDVTIDISTTDYVRFVCTTYGGAAFDLAVSGFFAATAASQSVTGDVHILAPTGPFSITVGTATAAAANPIAVPLTGRVSLSIRNKDPANTIYFGASVAVTADDTATGGWEIGPGEDFNVDLDSSESFFLITPAATTAVYKILEIAST